MLVLRCQLEPFVFIPYYFILFWFYSPVFYKDRALFLWCILKFLLSIKQSKCSISQVLLSQTITHRSLVFCSGNNLTWAHRPGRCLLLPLYRFSLLNYPCNQYRVYNLCKTWLKKSSYCVSVSSMTLPFSSTIVFFFSYCLNGLK